MPDKTITITEDAQQVIMDMRNRLSHIRANFGEYSEEYSNMAGSLAFALAQMLNLGGRITKDSELSLYCIGEHIHYGVNFSNSNYRDLPEPHNLMGDWSVNS